MYLGDVALNTTIDHKFTTVNVSGVPTALVTPTVWVNAGVNPTQLPTPNFALTVSFNGFVGMNHIRLPITAANGYVTGTDYQVILVAGTVGGNSVVGYVICEFSVENRSALRPTVKDRTLDVSLTGEAGVDWANVGTPGAANNLAATTVQNVQNVLGQVAAIGLNGVTAASMDSSAIAEIQAGLATAAALATVQADTDNLQTRLPAALVGGKMDSVVAGVTLDPVAVDAVWDEVIEGTLTARQALRVANAANAGKLSGAATNAIKVRDLADTKDRISASVDPDGNRLAVVLDVT